MLSIQIRYMNRPEMLRQFVAHRTEWDIIIIGGGASGVGCAVDAAARGHRVLLLERSDFGKGTSSRSTKLIHGGVRYLEQGNISLVTEALKERGILRRNAPHLVHDLPFIVPNYDWWEMPYYGVGLKVYDLLAKKYRFGRSQILSKEETLEHIPTLNVEGLRGGVLYYDGQFDDSRLLMNLVTTAVEQGATVLNYAQVTGLLKNADDFVKGVAFTDALTGSEFEVKAKVVINATGAFCDEVRRMSDAGARPLITPSQGIHLVFDRSFLPTENAIMVPRTDDGRVLFAIPWQGHTLVGTTDTPIQEAEFEPTAQEDEIEFILSTAQKYLHKPPTRKDILSVFTGIRPLVKGGGKQNTAALSRDHTIQIDSSRLLTLTGGKWTTYRHMAEDCINQAETLAALDKKGCPTKDLIIHGHHSSAEEFGDLAVYGSDVVEIRKIIDAEPDLGGKLHKDLHYVAAEVIWAVRNEMAQTVEDVLARRTRALFLNARAATEMAPGVAAIMASELGMDIEWQQEQLAEFNKIAKCYVPTEL